jgi:eukaryotic-like serine/threonine-protein kinase
LSTGAVTVGPGAELVGGRYRLERLIGAGGMASVWKGRDQRLDRPVAVKVLSDALAADPDFVARFRREAQVAARLSHPNLIRVFDYDPEGRPCLVMEYVPGGTLADTANRPGTAIEVEALAVQLLGALEHIHRAGIVHRDVKPANVLIGGDGRALLTDFGIAQPEDATRLTRTGEVIGTLAYMAPEVEAGERATPRSDLYSCGVVLRDHLEAGASPALRRLVDRLTEPAPELRPRSAGRALAYLADAQRPPVADVRHAAVATRGSEQARTEATEGMAPQPAPRELEPEPGAPPPRSSRPRPAAGREIPIRASHALLAALLAVGAIVAVIVIATVGGDDEPGQTAGGRGEPSAAASGEGAESQAEPADVIPPPKPNADPARGAALNDEGYGLIQSGDYDAAVRMLRKAVASFPEGTTDLNYAYALFNYGWALRLAGRPEEAIPVLEARLEIPNQTETVQAELDKARTAAGE